MGDITDVSQIKAAAKLTAGKIPVADANGIPTDSIMMQSSSTIGIDVTPKTWKSTKKALQIGSTAAVFGATTGEATISSNKYIGVDTVPRRIITGFASSFEQYGGTFYWLTDGSDSADAACSATAKMIFDVNGKLIIGSSVHTSPAQLIIKNIAPAIELYDTTSSAKSLLLKVDANLASLYERGGAVGDIITMDLANNNVGIGEATPTGIIHVKRDINDDPKKGIRKQVGNQTSTGWTEDTTRGNIELSGSGVLTYGSELVIIPEWSGSDAEYRAWMGVVDVEVFAMDSGTLYPGRYTFRLSPSYSCLAFVQTIVNEVFEDNAVGFLQCSVNSQPGSGHSSSIKLVYNAGPTGGLSLRYHLTAALQPSVAA